MTKAHKANDMANYRHRAKFNLASARFWFDLDHAEAAIKEARAQQQRKARNGNLLSAPAQQRLLPDLQIDEKWIIAEILKGADEK